MWFKKKANISGYDPNTAVDGTDWRTTGNGNRGSWSVSQTLPSAADAGNYFYLPALGYYDRDQLFFVDTTGNYWSSSTQLYAYSLYFSSNTVGVYGIGCSRGYGFRVKPTFE